MGETDRESMTPYNPTSQLPELKHELIFFFLPSPYKKEIDFCLEFVKSGTRGPVNGAPRGAG